MTTQSNAALPRYKWMATTGKTVFTDLMVEVAKHLGDHPMSYGSPSGLGRMDALERTLPFADEAVFKYFLMLGEHMTRAAMSVIEHRVDEPGQRTLMEQLLAREDLGEYLDIRCYADPQAHIDDSVRFGLVSNLKVAARALSEAPFISKEPMSIRQATSLVRELLAEPQFTRDVLEPLAATGFGVLSVGFVQILAAPTPIDLPGILESQEFLVEWAFTGEGWKARLNPSLRTQLVEAMNEQGRTVEVPRASKLSGGTTSSGCPVRHEVEQDDGSMRSGIAISVDISVRGLDEILSIAPIERAIAPLGTLD